MIAVSAEEKIKPKSLVSDYPYAFNLDYIIFSHLYLNTNCKSYLSMLKYFYFCLTAYQPLEIFTFIL